MAESECKRTSAQSHCIKINCSLIKQKYIYIFSYCFHFESDLQFYSMLMIMDARSSSNEVVGLNAKHVYDNERQHVSHRVID